VTFILRRARGDDADALAAVFSPSLRLLTFLPELHTVAEDREFIENNILKECEVSVIETAGRIISFLAREGEEIRLLHTHPEFVGQGAGGFLIRNAKSTGPATLQLWCFQENHGGRRFYERHGFKPERFTEGEGNEERLPDILYRWTR
jgi:putative acetyltransferase